jgi:hypothetical protein
MHCILQVRIINRLALDSHHVTVVSHNSWELPILEFRWPQTGEGAVMRQLWTVAALKTTRHEAVNLADKVSSRNTLG